MFSCIIEVVKEKLKWGGLRKNLSLETKKHPFKFLGEKRRPLHVSLILAGKERTRKVGGKKA